MVTRNSIYFEIRNSGRIRTVRTFELYETINILQEYNNSVDENLYPVSDENVVSIIKVEQRLDLLRLYYNVYRTLFYRV